MKTLRRSIRKSDIGGEPLAAPFQAFERAGIILRRAEVTVIAGTPGAGKSSIAFTHSREVEATDALLCSRYQCTHNGYEIVSTLR